MPSEKWKTVPGFPAYEVSSEGRVRSYARSANGRLLRPGTGPNGYPMVVLGRGNSRTVHSLVAEAFIGPRPEGQEVLHGDGTRDNPRLSNLRYGTRAENIQDAIKHGTWWGNRSMHRAA